MKKTWKKISYEMAIITKRMRTMHALIDTHAAAIKARLEVGDLHNPQNYADRASIGFLAEAMSELMPGFRKLRAMRLRIDRRLEKEIKAEAEVLQQKYNVLQAAINKESIGSVARADAVQSFKEQSAGLETELAILTAKFKAKRDFAVV